MVIMALKHLVYQKTLKQNFNMKTRFITYAFLTLLLSCKNELKDMSKTKDDEIKNFKISDKNKNLKTKDTIDFMNNYVYYLKEKKNNYFKKENLIYCFKDSTEIKKVSSFTFYDVDKDKTDLNSYNEDFFIDFEDFTLAFVANNETELYCEFKEIKNYANFFVVSIYMADNQLTCIIDKENKKYQIIQGEAISLSDDKFLICNNEIDWSILKLFKFQNNKIECINSLFSEEDAFYGFRQEGNVLKFLSTQKNVTKEFSYKLN